MARIGTLLLALTFAGCLMAGCGEPNDPDVPPGEGGAYEIAGEISTRGFVNDFDLVEDTLYVAENTAGIVFYDVSDLENPDTLMTHPTPDPPNHIIAEPSRNLFAYSTSSISYVYQIRELFEHELDHSFGSGGIRDLISEPRVLEVPSDWTGTDVTTEVARVIRADRDDGLHVTNLYPDSSQLSGSRYFNRVTDAIELGFGTAQPWAVAPLFASLDTVVVALRDMGIAVADVSPAAEAVGGAWLGDVDTPGEAQDVIYGNGYIFVADGVNGLVVVDASDLANLEVAAQWKLPGFDHIAGVALDGNRLAAVDEFDGVLFLDVSTPTEPDFKGLFEVRGANVAEFDDAGRLWVGSETRGITVLNLLF